VLAFRNINTIDAVQYYNLTHPIPLITNSIKQYVVAIYSHTGFTKNYRVLILKLY